MSGTTTRAASALLLGFTLLACGPSDEERAAKQSAATQVVESFGARLMHVSLLAEPDSIKDAIRAHYTPYVTTLQLGTWLSDVRTAPGRETSSPWPARIEVRDVAPFSRSAFDVSGDIVYVTSVDGDPIMREPIRARVVRGPDGIWRISEWHEGS